MIPAAAVVGYFGWLVEEKLRHERANWRDQHDQTPLYNAAADGDIAQIKELVAHGAEINARNLRDGSNLTALMITADRGHAKIVRQLIEAGANVNLRDKGGQTALCDVLNNGPEWDERHNVTPDKKTRITEMLINADANVNVRDNEGYTALDDGGDEGEEQSARLIRLAGGRCSQSSGAQCR